jgi:hypothetical protein
VDGEKAFKLQSVRVAASKDVTSPMSALSSSS